MAAPKPEKSSNIPPNVDIKENLYAMSARFKKEKEESLCDIPFDAYKDLDSRIAFAISMDDYPTLREMRVHNFKGNGKLSMWVAKVGRKKVMEALGQQVLQAIMESTVFCFALCFILDFHRDSPLGFRLVLPMECVFDCVSFDHGVCPESKTDTDHKCGMYMSLLLYILVNVLFRR